MNGTVQFVAHGAAGQTLGDFNTEMLQLSMSGTAGATPVLLRESPTLASLGKLDFSGIFEDSKVPGVDPQNGFEIGSFFDVFTELSLDGGQSWNPSNSGASHLLHHQHPRTRDAFSGRRWYGVPRATSAKE